MSENESTDKSENMEAQEMAEQHDDHDHDQDHHDHEGHDHHHHEHDHDEEYKFVEDPAFDVEYKGDCAYEVKVSIPPANTQSQTTKLLDELQAEAELPGFRRGRAPRKLLEKKFGKAMRGDATEKLLNAAFLKLVKDKDLKPMNLPEIDGLDKLIELGEADPITCTFRFEVFPRCELGRYRGIEVERPVVKISSEDIENNLNELRSRFAVYETVADAEAQEGDQVIIDFQGTINGEIFQGGSAQNYPYILGSKRFFAEFEKALEGARTGEERACDVQFPENYSSAQLAGKLAHFTIKVEEIKRKQLPALDDAFAKQAGTDSVDALRERVTKDLQDAALAESNSIAQARALHSIVQDSTFEIPKTLLENMSREEYEKSRRRLAEMRISAAEIDQREDELRATAADKALKSIQIFVVIREIVEGEGVEVTDADFEKEAANISGRLGMSMDVVNKFIRDEERRSEYEDRILRAKALDVIMANAIITDKEVTREAINAELEEADEEDES